MWKFLVLSTLISLALVSRVTSHCATADEMRQFEEFKMKFGKQYKSMEEEQMRLGLFLNSLHIVNEINKQYAEGKSSYTAGINKFSDWAPEEKKHMFGLLREPMKHGSSDMLQESHN